MSKKSSRRLPKKPMITQTVIHPDAAGIDVASEVHYVAVPADRDPQPVRNFGPTTDQLNVMADWLQKCGIRRRVCRRRRHRRDSCGLRARGGRSWR